MVRLFGSVMLVSASQLLKADVPIVWRPSGSVTLVSPETAKAYSPIVVTSFGIVTPVSAVQLVKAYSPIVVTLAGTVKVVPGFLRG